MSKQDDGGPAFPEIGGRGQVAHGEGMSLREYFAAAALPAIATLSVGMIQAHGKTPDDLDPESLVRVAFEVSDAMLRERQSDAAE